MASRPSMRLKRVATTNKNFTDMIQLTPIAIAATSQQYAARIRENLCSAFCLTDAIQPTANVTYSVSSIKVVSGTAFVTIAANGSIQYVPKGCNPCKVRTRMFNEEFVLAFVGTGTPTVTITQGSEVQAADNVKCCNRAYGWSITTNLAVAATFPAA